ncbi:MAG: hypothetical protein ACYC9O_02005 [Candidatus Latescibacterota bacterium]
MNRRTVFIGILLAAMACLAIAPVVTAQQFQRQTPEERVAEMEKVLKITPEQKSQILKFYQDQAANRGQGGGGGGRGGARGGFMGGGMLPEALTKILTPDQVKKWQAYQVQQNVDRRITQIDEAVTLTADQKTKIRPIIEKEIAAQGELFAKMRAEDQNFDRDAMMSKMQEIREATTKGLSSILTKEQMDKYNAMPRGGGRRGQ